MTFIGTFWALVPALVAIILALITKEVYSSLFIGIVIGALFFTGFNPVAAFDQVVQGGLIKVLSDSYNVGILIFLVVLGAMVSLLNKSGGSKAFGEWASKNIKSKAGALLATWFFGVLIFVDDYFNCLTVGSVMRPVTDKYKISRAKLAYIIDATAAPICIIAPISSWAAAVTGFVEGEDGLALFMKAIPYNYYAIFTMIFIIATTLLGVNFGKMKKCEDAATNGDLFYGEQVVNRETSYNEEKILGPGKVIDLVIPIITLVVLCIIGLIYSGGFYSSDSESFGNFVVAFSNADASVGLALGSMFALILTMIYYLVKKVLSFNEIMSSLTEGFKNMVPAILILTFAWTLKAMIDSLEATAFIDGIVRSNVATMSTFLPAIIFLLGAGISFATGTSWGTFGILIPIVVYILKAIDPQLMIIGISAAMAGSVFGDHCSPISDTTIMSSAGAQCEHLLHVSTQLSYAVYVAVVSFICYIVAGITKSPFIPLIVGVVVLLVGLFVLKNKNVSA
ncbi:MAG: Na+/H+ antiporter NhaC family protein [Lachnospiraceae bacterium]|nr:Na+/H+ antiporter NhaC family protein [Lachnospiraceae bacterium]